MNRKERTLLLRAISGELTEHERSRLRDLLDRSPEAREQIDRMERIERAVRGSAEDSLMPGFENLVIGRLAAPAAEDRFAVIADLLRVAFARVAPAAFALALVIAVYNAINDHGAGTPVEALLGLRHVSISAAYEAELLAPDADQHSDRRELP